MKKSLNSKYTYYNLIADHLLVLSGDNLFKLSMVAFKETFGPPDNIETNSSALASKNTRVKNAFERT